MADHIENVDPNDRINIDNDVQVNFEDLIDEDTDEESVLPDDSGCDSVISEDLENRVEKVVTSAELRALNFRTKHCMIQFCYSTGGALAVCATCMIDFSDIELGSMDAVQIHETDSLERLSGDYCSSCMQPMFTYIPTKMCPMCVKF
jgi:hypothetical protein